ncbi:hypothetical protein SLE2022_291390 [Rubroshorea leprosula]
MLPAPMFYQQQASFAYYSQFAYSNHNPNPLFSFPLPIPPAEPPLHPPGTDPSTNLNQYSVTYVYEAQKQVFEDPNAGSQSWVTKQADPIRYDDGWLGSVVPTTSNSFASSNWNCQPSVNDDTGSMLKQKQHVQTMQCEVCKINCDTKDVYDNHIMGKKHQKNLRKQNNPRRTILHKASKAINKASLSGPVGYIGKQMLFGVSARTASLELEIRRQKLLNSGAAVDSVRICTICNVACNSEEVLNAHLAGKGHAAQSGLIALNGVGPHLGAIRPKGRILHKKKREIKVVQSVWCDVCKIDCNTNDVYSKHLLGKKHQKNLEKLEKSKSVVDNPASNAAPHPIIGPVENPEANEGNAIVPRKSQKRAAQSEDLETKKRRVLEGGAAAAEVRVCTVCNVVCNSQQVFNFHLAGQKHAAKVNKAAATMVPTITT